MTHMIERWAIVAGLVAVVAGMYHVFTKLASGKIPDVVGGFWLESTALIVMGLYLLFTRQPLVGPEVKPSGVLFAMAGGVCVALGTVLTFTTFRLHGPLSAAGPIILVGALVVMAIAGIIFMGESLSWTRTLGFVFAIAAIWLLSR